MKQKLIPKPIIKANSGVKMQKPHFTEEERQELIASGMHPNELWNKSKKDKDLENKLIETFYYMPRYSHWESVTPVDSYSLAWELLQPDNYEPINPSRYYGDRIDNAIELPEVVVTPSELQQEFFRVNPNIYKNNPNFFNGGYNLNVYRDDYRSNDDEKYDFLEWVYENYKDPEGAIIIGNNPEIIDRFYKLWELAGKPKIDNHLPGYYMDRAHMNPLTRNIYLSNTDKLSTAIAEISHIIENNNEPGQHHNFLEGYLALEEQLGMDWNFSRYDVPGTQEQRTHHDIQPRLESYVYYGYPTKVLPKKPISTADNISNSIFNMFGGSPYKSIMKIGHYLDNRFLGKYLNKKEDDEE